MLTGYVKCLKSGDEDAFTVGEIYKVEEGMLYGNPGYTPKTMNQDIDYVDIEDLNNMEGRSGNQFELYFGSRDYTDTIRFKKSYALLKKAGIPEEDLLKYKEVHKQFDIWGNEKGTDYSKCEIAYDVSELG